MDFVPYILNNKGIPFIQFAFRKNLAETKIRICGLKRMLEVFEYSAVKSLFQLHYEGIICQSKANLFPVSKKQLEMSKNKQLLLIFLACTNNFIKGNNEIFFICIASYN
jgi:hypothetical protein